jgi:hypothetical protein
MKIGIAILMTSLAVATARAEDIETVNHRVYKDATVSRVEPDGIVITMKSGIVKIPFTELSEEYQKRFGYDPEAAKVFAADVERQQSALSAQMQAEKEKAEEQRARIAQLNQDDLDLAKARREAEASKKRAEQIKKEAFDKHRVWIGMSAEECIQSCSYPLQINKTVTAKGVQEQWVYPAAEEGKQTYLYFENGILTTMQN